MNSGFVELRIWVKKEDKTRILKVIEKGLYQSISEFSRLAIKRKLDILNA